MILLASGVGGWWWLQQQKSPADSLSSPPPAQVEMAASEATPDPPPSAPAATGGFTTEIPDTLPGIPGAGGKPAPTPAQTAAATAAAPSSTPAPEPSTEEAAAETEASPASTAIFPDTLALDEVEGNKAEAVHLRKSLLNLAFEKQAWPGYSAMLFRSLVAATQRYTEEPPTEQEITKLLAMSHFRQALTQRAVLQAIPQALRKRQFSDTAHRPFFEALLTDPELGEAFLINLTPQDKLESLLETWAELWTEDAAARGEYRELALACALVFEKPQNIRWNGQTITLTAQGRYAWYKKHDQASQLVGRIRQMKARDLVWAVCAPVPDSELEWALKKIHLRQSKWGQAYTMVEYDMERAVEGANKYDAYTFSEILKKGGICGDRAYFAANTARAFGIPAADISGDGPRGGHAWFRWLDTDGEWHMEGRFAGYAHGNTRDPQTQQGVSEEMFVQRSERKATADTPVREACQRLWLGQIMEEDEDFRRAGAAYDLAAKANREMPSIAEARLRHWLAYRKHSPLEEWKEILSRLKKDFRENSALMSLVAEAEETVVFPKQSGKAVMANLRKDVRQMEKEARKDGSAPRDEDLARTYSRQADVLKKAGNIDGVHSLYRRALDDRGNAATFKALARDYFKITSDTPSAAARACRTLEAAWNRHVDTGGDYFDIGSQNSALAVIIDCYRKIDNTRKADSLQRDLDRRQNRAERRAL